MKAKDQVSLRGIRAVKSAILLAKNRWKRRRDDRRKGNQNASKTG